MRRFSVLRSETGMSVLRNAVKLACRNKLISLGLRCCTNSLLALGLIPQDLIDRISALPIGASTFCVTLSGRNKIRLTGDSRSTIARALYWQGSRGYEYYTTRAFCQLAKRASFIIDVGANVGYYSLIAALANPSALVIAFEPNDSLVSLLNSNIRLNAAENVVVVPAAVGQAKGLARLFFPKSDSLPDSASTCSAFFPMQELETLDVEMVSLDSAILGGNYDRRVDLIKIDTESTEDKVLLGANGLLERDHPDIFCEVLASSATATSLSRQLWTHGYAVYKILGGQLLSTKQISQKHDTNGRTISRELLFSRREPAELLSSLSPVISRIVPEE